MSAYHYEHFVFTDNLCWGRVFLGKSKSLSEARQIGRSANKGCFVVERHRVYNHQN